MQIMYRTTGHTRNVEESIGRRLVASRIADAVKPKVVTRVLKADEDEEVEISPRTGKPKRKYKRRDLRAED